MSSRNSRLNLQGNTQDENGVSYYVFDDDDEKVAGPFGSAPYASTVLRRLDGQYQSSLYIDTRR